MMVIEHADFDGIERLSAATGAEILSTFDNPERKSDVKFINILYFIFL